MVSVCLLQFQLVLFTDVLASLSVLTRFISALERPEVVVFYTNDDEFNFNNACILPILYQPYVRKHCVRTFLNQISMNKCIAAPVAVCIVKITLHCLFNRVPISSSAQNECLPNEYNSYDHQGVIYLAEGQINVCNI